MPIVKIPNDRENQCALCIIISSRFGPKVYFEITCYVVEFGNYAYLTEPFFAELAGKFDIPFLCNYFSRQLAENF